MPEVASLIAPRTCIWTVGDRDGLLDPAWVEKFRERQGRVYLAHGAREQVHVDRFAGGHQWHGDVAYPILARTLQYNDPFFTDEMTSSFSSDWHLNHGEWKIVDGALRGVEDASEKHPAAAR